MLLSPVKEVRRNLFLTLSFPLYLTLLHLLYSFDSMS